MRVTVLGGCVCVGAGIKGALHHTTMTYSFPTEENDRVVSTCKIFKHFTYVSASTGSYIRV